MEGEQKPRLDKATIIAMLQVALFFDIFGLQGLIPVIGTMIDWMLLMISTPLFVFWFWTKGVSFKKPGVIIPMIVGTIVEAIPEVHALPGLTAEVALVILSTVGEDTIKAKTGIDVNQVAGKVAGGAGPAGTAGKQIVSSI